MIRTLDRQPQGGQVFDRLPKQPVELLVAGFQLEDSPSPLLRARSELGGQRVGEALGWRLVDAFAVDQVMAQTGVPGMARLNVDLKRQPAVGDVTGAVAVANTDTQRATEALVGIGCREGHARRIPAIGDAAASHEVIGLHIEDISEVATNHDLEIKADRLRAVVRDLEILM